MIPTHTYLAKCYQGGQETLYLVRTFGSIGAGDRDFVRERLEDGDRTLAALAELPNNTTRQAVEKSGLPCKSVYMVIQ